MYSASLNFCARSAARVGAPARRLAASSPRSACPCSCSAAKDGSSPAASDSRESGYSTPWPKTSPPRRSICPVRARCATTPSNPILPRHTITRRFASAAISSSRYGAHRAISSGNGLFPGGAQRTTDVIQASVEPHAVVAIRRVRLRGKSRLVQQRVEKVAGTVAGEGPSRPIRSVRSGRQPDEQHPRRRIAKRGNRPAPVGPLPARRASSSRRSPCSAGAGAHSARRPRCAGSVRPAPRRNPAGRRGAFADYKNGNQRPQSKTTVLFP